MNMLDNTARGARAVEVASPGAYVCAECGRPGFKTDALARVLCMRCAGYRGEPIAGAAVPTGRNCPCPCASGKKYKKCCGKR